MSKYEFTLLQNYLSPKFEIVTPGIPLIKGYFKSKAIKSFREYTCFYKWSHNKFKYLNIETHYSFSTMLFNSSLNIEEQSSQLQEIIKDICDRTKIGWNEILFQKISSSSSQIVVQFKVLLSLETLSDNQLISLYHQHIINSESERIGQAINDNVFQCSDENELRHFIHKKQNIISHLCFQYHRQVIEVKTVIDQPEIKQLKQTAYEVLLSLMELIETQYFNYININIEIPYRNVMLNDNIDKDRLKKVKETLLKMPLDKSLLKAIYNPLVRLSAFTHVDKITYREFLYYVFFVNELHNDILEHGESFNENKLINILNAINYNHQGMFYYGISIIKQELNKEPAISKQVNLLYHYLKEYNQMQVNTRLAYNPNLPSTRLQIITWIEEEINYIQRVNTIEEEGTIEPTREISKKVAFNLSVAQLAYFVKLLVEGRVIDGTNQNELMRFLANHCQTLKTEEISFKSLSSKFYNIEQSTKQSVKDIVIKLLNLANRKE